MHLIIHKIGCKIIIMLWYIMPEKFSLHMYILNYKMNHDVSKLLLITM